MNIISCTNTSTEHRIETLKGFSMLYNRMYMYMKLNKYVHASIIKGKCVTQTGFGIKNIGNL